MSEVDYKDVATLRSALNRDGTIPRRRSKLNKKSKRQSGSGACRKHQAQLARAVKRARFMALLPQAEPHRMVEWPPKERKRR